MNNDVDKNRDRNKNINRHVNKPAADVYKIENRPITDLERSKGRSENYWQMSGFDQWNENERLGLLGWNGEDDNQNEKAEQK